MISGSLFTGSVIAQEFGRRQETPKEQAGPVDATDPAARQAAAEAQAQAQAAQEKQLRLQKIQQLQFDRRPSAILDTWSTPEKSDDESGGESSEKDGETAAAEPESAVPSAVDSLLASKLAQLGYVSGGTEVLMSSSGGVIASEMTASSDPFDQDLVKFQRNVTLGNWSEVKSFLASLEEDLAKAAYLRLLTVLRSPPPPKPGRSIQPIIQPYQEKHVVDFDDCLALIEAAPVAIDDGILTQLGGLVKNGLTEGRSLESLLERLRAERQKPEEDQLLTRRYTARLLFAADQPVAAGEFLPRRVDAEGAGDHQALNLLARYHLGLYEEEPKTVHLENAWDTLQAVFASGEIKKKDREDALRLAVGLAPKVRDDLGQTWLEESFTKHPQRGMEIIAAIGTAAAEAIETKFRDAEFRQKGLALQSTTAEALLSAAPERAESWSEPLALLATNWLREASISYQFDTSTSLGPQMQRDAYGNFYYYDRYFGRNSQIAAIPTGELLEIRPGEGWLANVEDSLRSKFLAVYSQLYLKVGEEDEAFPYIEQLAPKDPAQAEDLVEEFLRVWTQNHDPNSAQNRSNIYLYSYGYNQRAESIPLTRSKQERNLVELAELVKRLKQLPLGDLNEDLLANAFTTCHSSAEVYRIEAIERVFGSLDSLEPKTLAALVQRMRTNLAGVWRDPAVQEENKTKRRKKDIEREVSEGYRLAGSVLKRALEEHPDDWSLRLALASIAHDENNYQSDIQKSTDFTARRLESLQRFEEAADLYSKTVGDLEVDEETTSVFETWFYASLGACDLQALDQEQISVRGEPEKIREKILALPGEAAERHLAMFANTLFTRMSAVNPAVKQRYLTGGFEIVGDHPQATEARKVFEYYRDLVTEIRLEARIDGSDVVGQEPFGVFVNLVHTREIERESGGFGRYLQNQNNAYSSYNYGRPTENYRDKFEESSRQALVDHFEVLSITFQDDKVNSRALPEYGWRMTPYAYLLLKARGPEVDRIPPVRLDLDFLDTSGYVVLPIETSPLPIDAKPAQGAERPASEIHLTQTLDERQADEGKLVLEVKASARGLVPDLPELVDLEPEGFVVKSSDDQGLSVVQFDEASEENAVVSERTWLVTMEAAEGAEKMPESFRFGTPARDDIEPLYQRYVDADLAAVGPDVVLEREYAEDSRAWMFWVGGGLLLLLLVFLTRPLWKPARTELGSEGLSLPEKLTPFTVIGLLREIERRHTLESGTESQLESEIHRLEQHYFQNGTEEELDLRGIAESWLGKASSAVSGGR
ncbi:MAG: hypothetical protein RL885_29850 [Planctomycetota bacterium]